jgi:hypothetical protein
LFGNRRITALLREVTWETSLSPFIGLFLFLGAVFHNLLCLSRRYSHAPGKFHDFLVVVGVVHKVLLYTENIGI